MIGTSSESETGQTQGMTATSIAMVLPFLGPRLIDLAKGRREPFTRNRQKRLSHEHVWSWETSLCKLSTEDRDDGKYGARERS